MDENGPGDVALDLGAGIARRLLELRVRHHGDGGVFLDEDGGSAGVFEEGAVSEPGGLQLGLGHASDGVPIIKK